MTKFMPGLKLSELFFTELVRPILKKNWPTLEYSAALLGYGSEVLGFDTPRSMDHEWGPRVLLFLREKDCAGLASPIHALLARTLPRSFRGFPTHFGPTLEKGTERMTSEGSGPLRHRVRTQTVKAFFVEHLGLDPSRPIGVTDWLTFSEQHLLEVTRGAVFHDGLRELVRLQRRLAYYPRDIWLYMLACQWARIGQEDAFVGRCGEVGDELGSQLIAGRLVRDLMRLCFLMARQYAPYGKWFGTAFSKLKCGAQLRPVFIQVLLSRSWRQRERHLSQAYEIVAGMHNAMGITKPLPTKVSPFWGRPFLVIHADGFAREIRKCIRSKKVKQIGKDIGSVSQFVDCTDLTDSARLCREMSALFA